MKLQNNVSRVLLIVCICFFDIVPTSIYFSILKNQNLLFSVKRASEHLPNIIFQNIIAVAFSIICLILMILYLKENFVKEMSLAVKGKKQIIWVSSLGIILMIMLIALLIEKDDKITIIYGLIYYLFHVAFLEEFIIRGVCVYFVKDFPKVCTYLIPNLLFAMMHIFNYNDFNMLNISYVLDFLSNYVLGLVVMGCIFQALKNKTGTLWVSIFLHAIMDFSGMFTI